MKPFDWHSASITTDAPANIKYKNTHNVRRFLRARCGENFKFDRSFMAWINDGNSKTMGDVALEWKRRRDAG